MRQHYKIVLDGENVDSIVDATQEEAEALFDSDFNSFANYEPEFKNTTFCLLLIDDNGTIIKEDAHNLR